MLKTYPIYTTKDSLWQALLEGQEHAYEQILAEYGDALLAYGLKFTPDRDLVKDCIQNVLIHFYSQINRLSPINNLKSYLLVMLKHELVNQLNDWHHTLISIDEMPVFNLRASQCLLPKEGLDDAAYQRHVQLMKLLDELPPRQKEAIYLYYIQEIPLKEIAVLMDMEYQSIRNLISRSLRKLREKIVVTGSSSLSLIYLLNGGTFIF